MSQQEKHLCPFSKPILGKWCQCSNARLFDRCAGKMHCEQPDTDLKECQSLVKMLEKNSRFIIGVTDRVKPLTHQKMMKIKCGGILGMNRVLKDLDEDCPSILGVISEVKEQFVSFDAFPYGQIVRDISTFSVRKKCNDSARVSN